MDKEYLFPTHSCKDNVGMALLATTNRVESKHPHPNSNPHRENRHVLMLSKPQWVHPTRMVETFPAQSSRSKLK